MHGLAELGLAPPSLFAGEIREVDDNRRRSFILQGRDCGTYLIFRSSDSENNRTGVIFLARATFPAIQVTLIQTCKNGLPLISGP